MRTCEIPLANLKQGFDFLPTLPAHPHRPENFPKPQTPAVLTPQHQPSSCAAAAARSGLADPCVASNPSPGRNVSLAPGCNHILTQRGLFFFLFANIKIAALLRNSRVQSVFCRQQAQRVLGWRRAGTQFCPKKSNSELGFTLALFSATSHADLTSPQG